ncbi:MAG: hypothetical protein AAGJ18_06995 [Bacteroidota bacterium]
MKKEVKNTLKRLSWLAIILLVGVVLINMVEKKQTTKTVEVLIDVAHLPDGNDLITRGDIFEILDRSFGYSIEGIPLNEVDVARIEKVLKESPFVLDAEVYLGANNAVQIEVEQRIPVIRIIDKMGVSYYLDKDGNKLPPSKHFTVRVLTATGNIPPHTPEFMEKASHPLNQLFDVGKRILADDLFHPMMEQIYVNNKREYTLIPKLGNQKILFGKYENVDIKLENLKVFYQKAIANEGWRKYKTFDLRYAGQVVAVKR